jgi:outer membrane autotransporter protein
LEVFKAGLYASYHPGDWTFSGSASGSFQTIESKRLTLLPTPATADYDAASFNAGIEAARRMAISDTAFFEPMAGFNYSHLHTDAFTEAGGGGLGLSVDAENTDTLKAYIGARLAGTFDMGNSMTITPELRGRVVYDVLGDGRDITATLTDAAIPTPFAVSGLEPDRLGGIIGAGLTLAGTQNWQATLSYDAEIRGGDVLHTARAGFNWAF